MLPRSLRGPRGGIFAGGLPFAETRAGPATGRSGKGHSLGADFQSDRASLRIPAWNRRTPAADLHRKSPSEPLDVAE